MHIKDMVEVVEAHKVKETYLPWLQRYAPKKNYKFQELGIGIHYKYYCKFLLNFL